MSYIPSCRTFGDHRLAKDMFPLFWLLDHKLEEDCYFMVEHGYILIVKLNGSTSTRWKAVDTASTMKILFEKVNHSTELDFSFKKINRESISSGSPAFRSAIGRSEREGVLSSTTSLNFASRNEESITYYDN